MTHTPTDALRLVPVSGADIQALRELTRIEYYAGKDEWAGALERIIAHLTAPASPLPGGGWQDISTFRESGKGNPVIVAVPTKEGGWIVGEAWKSVMEADDPYRGNDGWWWAGTSPGDAYNDPIRFMNHGDAEWWMPLPAAPTGEPK